jgi:uncharacterized membrane protein
MASRSNTLLLASAVAGLMTLSALVTPPAMAGEEGGKVHCYGVNKCKGTGECGGKGHSCAGENACKGQGWLSIDKDTCLKIQGGRLTAEESK